MDQPYIRKISAEHIYLILLVSALCLASIVVVAKIKSSEKVAITTGEISRPVDNPEIKGKNILEDSSRLQSRDKLTYISDELKTNDSKSNALVFSWQQSRDQEKSVQIEVRTKNGRAWSPWKEIESDDDERKDGTTQILQQALVLSSAISQMQYRINLTGSPEQPSAVVDLSKIDLATINSSSGPKFTSKKSRLFGFLKSKSAQAAAGGPRVISRAEWGSPEGNASPRWQPEYRALGRAIIHHTVTTDTPDSGAAMRAIWQFHANSKGWGDIGYNYVVDKQGNIFQGRAFDPTTANALKADVVGGHAEGNNYGTTGIAMLGDYSNTRPPDITIENVSNVVGYKLAPYNVAPSGFTGAIPSTVGHRDVKQTACPGAGVYNELWYIRPRADQHFNVYRQYYEFDVSNQGQGFDGYPTTETNMRPHEKKDVYFDLKNEGASDWVNNGPGVVRLGTDAPQDRSSPFYDSSTWISKNRASTFSQKVVIDQNQTKQLVNTNVVKPGEIARFTFSVTAPSNGGSWLERYKLVSEGKQWFPRDLRLSFRANVSTNTYSWKSLGQHIFTDASKTQSYRTDNLTGSQKVYLVVDALNTGNVVWNKNGDHPVRLGTDSPRDHSSAVCSPTNWLGCNRPAALIEETVAPGEIGHFEFYAKIPSSNRGFVYRDNYNLVVENSKWMDAPAISWQFSTYPMR